MQRKIVQDITALLLPACRVVVVLCEHAVGIFANSTPAVFLRGFLGQVSGCLNRQPKGSSCEHPWSKFVAGSLDAGSSTPRVVPWMTIGYLYQFCREIIAIVPQTMSGEIVRTAKACFVSRYIRCNAPETPIFAHLETSRDVHSSSPPVA